MIFQSKLQKLETPHQDVFNYIFSHRRDYDADRVLYRTDDNQETLTLRQLEERSRRFAHGLVTRYGIQPQDAVAILAADSIAYPIAYFGILAAGATVQLIPIQSQLTPSEVTSRLAQAEAKLLVTDSVYLVSAKKAVSSMGNPIPLLVQDCSCSSHSFSGPGAEYHGFKLRTEAGAASYSAFINRTSGSTGNMKSVITTHAHFIAALEATLHTVPSNTDGDADVWLSTISLGFFINAKLHMGLNILLGIPVVLMKIPFGPQTLDLVEKHRVTFMFLPPPVASSIAKDKSSLSSGVDLSSIKWLLTAGAPMHEALATAISSKLNNVHMTMEWATSETLLIAIQLEGRPSVPGSSGTLVNGIEARVVDTRTGLDLGPNDKGEILVRNQVAPYAGYKSNDAANKATFDSEGWFHSGDFGFLDEEGNVFITDRLKELIRVGGGYGVHISATEIEAVLFEHPAVAQVIVTALPDPETTIDLPTAFIILKPEYDQDRISALASIETWAERKLSSLQRLAGGIVFVPRFPTVGFKVNRRALKGMIEPGVVDEGMLRYVEVAE